MYTDSSEIRPFKETGVHSFHRRAISHNYYAPFIYHIILKKAKCCESFGSVSGDPRIPPGAPGCARIDESPIGRIIAKVILHLPFEFPAVKILQFCVMPDHVHLLLQIVCRTDKHLDRYIKDLKEMIASRYAVTTGKDIEPAMIFEPGYCDKPLYDNRSLDGLFRYIRENPHRLAVRMQFPQFFRRMRRLKIGERVCEAYGNLFLLRNPDKEAVKVSRSYTPEEVLRKKMH